MREQWLCHHGVKGMKWGVRLYQRKDGTLTPLGRRRYLDKESKLTNAGEKAFTDNNGVLTERGLALINAYTEAYNINDSEQVKFFKEHKDLTIKKGEQFMRYADLDEPLDHKRKYVAYGEELCGEYAYWAMEGGLEIKNSKYASYLYKAKKDLKVGFITPDEITTKYIKPTEQERQQIELSDRHVPYSDNYDSREVKYVRNVIAKSRDYVDNLYSKEIENIKPKLIKQGYDAVVDWNDINLSIVNDKRTEYPLIILDPKKAIKLSKYFTN